MASNTDSIKEFFLKFEEGLIKEAAVKNQKIPVSSFRFEADETGGQFWAADYLKYLVTGRGPGKFPPPTKMLEWVQANPDVLERARQTYKYLTAKGLAFLIGRKIANEGTDIFTGKKQGIDLLGVLDENMKELLAQLARNEVVKIATDLKNAVK